VNNVALIDLETTGLLKPEAMDENFQPHIIEICVMRGDAVFTSFIKPPIPISQEIQTITGITDAMVKDAPSFARLYPSLVQFMLGAETLVAHNLAFDKGVLIAELRRIGKEFNFPWPPIDVCTVEKSLLRVGRRVSLAELYEQVTGVKHIGAHRAHADVVALGKVYDWLA